MSKTCPSDPKSFFGAKDIMCHHQHMVQIIKTSSSLSSQKTASPGYFFVIHFYLLGCTLLQIYLVSWLNSWVLSLSRCGYSTSCLIYLQTSCPPLCLFLHRSLRKECLAHPSSGNSSITSVEPSSQGDW